MRGRKRLPPDKPSFKNETPPRDEEKIQVKRPERAQRIADNKRIDYVAVKTTLNTFCKRGGRFLPGRALPWEEFLADMNKAVLEAYLLANVHVLRLLEEENEMPTLDTKFFRTCLSAVMSLLRNRKVKGELGESLKVYNASRCARSPPANGGYINQGWCHNAAQQMATMTKNALSMNFYRRFHKFLKRTYMIDGNKVYTLLQGILSHEPYVPQGNPFDSIIQEWRERIPRQANGRLTDDAHRLVPLTYMFLKDIEERNLYGSRVDDGSEQYRGIQMFTHSSDEEGV